MQNIENAEILADEDQWWNKGHELYEASEELRQWSARGVFSDTRRVGGPVSRTVDPTGLYYRWQRDLIAEMLYAFALENWLKGLLVAQYPRLSELLRTQISAAISVAVGTNEMSTEEILDAVSEAMNTDEIAEQLKVHASQRTAEDQARAGQIDKHKNHDLCRLAIAAGVQITEEQRMFLDALSIVNQLGRYPALRKSSPIDDIEPFVGNAELREKVNQAIWRRHDDVTDMPQIRVS